MADAQLSVEITAQIDGFKKSLKEAEAASNKLNAGTKKNFSEVNKNISALNKLSTSGVSKSFIDSGNALKYTSSAAAPAAKNVENIAKSFNKVSDSATKTISSIDSLKIKLESYKRISQSATDPSILTKYNAKIDETKSAIDKLTNAGKEGFDSLGNKTVTAGEAIGESLGGVKDLIDILPGITVASALAFAAGPILEYIQANIDAQEEVSELQKTLDILNGTRLTGAQNAQQELVQLQSLYSISQDATVSLKQRKDAVDQLQSQYPEYFKNLKDETVLNGGAKTAYDKLTLSIIATARARAAQDVLVQNNTRQLSNEQRILTLQDQQLKNTEKLNKISQDVGFNAEAGVGGEAPFAEQKQKGVIRDTQKQINDLKTDSILLDRRNLAIAKEITDQVKAGADLAGKVGDLPGAEKQTRTVTDVLKDLNIELVQIQNTFDGTFGDKQKDRVNAYQKAINDLIKIGVDPANTAIQRLKDLQEDLFSGDLKNVPLSFGVTTEALPQIVTPKLDLNNINLGLSEYDKLLISARASQIDFENGLESLATAALGSGIADAFSSIGVALSEGTNAIEAFGQSLLSAFAGFLGQLGQMFIKEGIAQIGYGIAKNLILPGSGANNIAGGAGMIAAGAAISTIGGLATGATGGGRSKYQSVKQIPGFASGVTNFGGGLAMVGERGRELVNLPTGSSVIPNGRTERLMKGGNSMINISSELAISGGQLYALIRAEERSRGRAGI